MRFGMPKLGPCEGDGVPVHVGGVSVSRGGPTSGAHAAAAILISESGDTVKRRERRHAFRQAGADGETRYTLEPPPRDTRIKVQTDDPSPSARQFRLQLNGLARTELRRMFLQR